MPTEVLVMCSGCGQPQQAREGRCEACGAVLPEAPRPGSSASEAPFFLLELGGRMVAGVGRRLTYRADATVPPAVVELGSLRSVRLGRRFFLEPLAIVPLALVLTLLVPSVRPLTTGLSVLGLLVALLWRQSFVVLEFLDGRRVRWPLGTALIGSERSQRIDAVCAAAVQGLVARGVDAQDARGGLWRRA
ncbi:hypothetical protein POL68_10880 [Stigmatella sp. ncwal1]|uniref:Uncharacterized protein n=1 Tax=Stigmatella ashevillensis TaxID=2995309 RepID=A0ABT5D5N7_9BACT|nr:hypothetical protein [Stigmatella ashevillena]MDC0708967.1 hypothetical protein [Stigmatella ashevillena]